MSDHKFTGKKTKATQKLKANHFASFKIKTFLDCLLQWCAFNFL
jgi:hypothetical protein